MRHFDVTVNWKHGFTENYEIVGGPDADIKEGARLDTMNNVETYLIKENKAKRPEVVEQKEFNYYPGQVLPADAEIAATKAAEDKKEERAAKKEAKRVEKPKAETKKPTPKAQPASVEANTIEEFFEKNLEMIETSGTSAFRKAVIQYGTDEKDYGVSKAAGRYNAMVKKLIDAGRLEKVDRGVLKVIK